MIRASRNNRTGEIISNRFEMEQVTTNRFGLRLRGYVHPPTTGDYEFWLAAGVEAQLFLSPNERANDKVLIATVYSKGGVRDWDAHLVDLPAGLGRSVSKPAGATTSRPCSQFQEEKAICL